MTNSAYCRAPSTPDHGLSGSSQRSLSVGVVVGVHSVSPFYRGWPPNAKRTGRLTDVLGAAEPGDRVARGGRWQGGEGMACGDGSDP